MRFSIGFVTGLAVGYWLANEMSEDQRQRLEAKGRAICDDPRVRRLTSSIARDTGKVADAVTERVTDITDGVTDLAADAIAPN